MKVDISDEVELKNGRSNPFGWSVQDIYHLGARVGEVYCGEPKIDAPGYSFTLRKESKTQTRCRIFFDDSSGDLQTLRDAYAMLAARDAK